jgi:hypothetical protein
LRQAQTPSKTTRRVGGIATIEFQVVEAFHLPIREAQQSQRPRKMKARKRRVR